MKIVKSFQRHRELRRLRLRVDSDPSPGHYVQLCERLLAARRPAEVRPLLDEARRRFPWSERLQGLAFRVHRAMMRDEVRRLAEAMERCPTPELYGRLAEIHRQIGDDDEAIRLCRDCAARFPQNENPFLVEGRLRVERFRRTGLARDGLLAAEKLERAVALNPDNMKARRILSELYFRVGAWRHARAHLDAILEGAVADEQIIELDGALRAHGEDSPGGIEDLAALFRRSLEPRGAASPRQWFGSWDAGPPGGAQATPRLEDIRELLAGIPGVVQVVTCVCLNREEWSRAPGPAPSDAGDQDGLTALARFLSGIAQTSLVEMDMGNLRHAQISGSWGHLLVFRIASWVLAVRADPEANPAEIRERVLSIRATNATTSGGR